MIEYDRAIRRRIDDIRQRQPGVVGRSVEVAGAAQQSARRKCRFCTEDIARTESDVSPDVTEDCEGIVEPESGKKLPARDARASIHRPGEGKWPYEVRCDAEQDPPLAARFPHEAQVPVLEVAHAAVHESRRAARSSAGKVVALDQRHSQATKGGVACHAGAGDAAPDDQHVEHALTKRRARSVAPGDGGWHPQE